MKRPHEEDDAGEEQPPLKQQARDVINETNSEEDDVHPSFVLLEDSSDDESGTQTRQEFKAAETSASGADRSIKDLKIETGLSAVGGDEEDSDADQHREDLYKTVRYDEENRSESSGRESAQSGSEEDGEHVNEIQEDEAGDGESVHSGTDVGAEEEEEAEDGESVHSGADVGAEEEEAKDGESVHSGTDVGAEEEDEAEDGESVDSETDVGAEEDLVGTGSRQDNTRGDVSSESEQKIRAIGEDDVSLDESVGCVQSQAGENDKGYMGDNVKAELSREDGHKLAEEESAGTASMESDSSEKENRNEEGALSGEKMSLDTEERQRGDAAVECVGHAGDGDGTRAVEVKGCINDMAVLCVEGVDTAGCKQMEAGSDHNVQVQTFSRSVPESKTDCLQEENDIGDGKVVPCEKESVVMEEANLSSFEDPSQPEGLSFKELITKISAEVTPGGCGNSTDIDTLPDEMLKEIFRYCGWTEVLTSLRLVCKRWFSICQRKDVWNHRDLWVDDRFHSAHDGFTDEMLLHLTQYVPLSFFDLRNNSSVTSEGLVNALKHAVFLEKLCLPSDFVLDDKLVTAFCENCPRLNHLVIPATSMKGPHAMDLGFLRNIPHLSVLAVEDCTQIEEDSYMSMFHFCRNLTRVSLRSCRFFSDTVMRKLSGSASKLTYLTLSGSHTLSASGFQAISTLTELVWLSLEDMHSPVDGSSLKSISLCCENLQYISFKGCRFLDCDAFVYISINLRELKFLYLTNTNVTNDTIKHVAFHCKKLRKLDVSCPQVTMNCLDQLCRYMNRELYMKLLVIGSGFMKTRADHDETNPADDLERTSF